VRADGSTYGKGNELRSVRAMNVGLDVRVRTYHE
jgi:hypothetical protein